MPVLQQETAQGQARADYTISQSCLSLQHNTSSVSLEGFFGLNEITLYSSRFLPQGRNSIPPAHLSPGRRLNIRDESKCSQSGKAICQSSKKEGGPQRRYLSTKVTCLKAKCQAAGSLRGSRRQEKDTGEGIFPLPWRLGLNTHHFPSTSCTPAKGTTQLEELKTQYKASPAWSRGLQSGNDLERRGRLKHVHYFRSRGKHTPLSPRDDTAPRGSESPSPSRGAKVKSPDLHGSPHTARFHFPTAVTKTEPDPLATSAEAAGVGSKRARFSGSLYFSHISLGTIHIVLPRQSPALPQSSAALPRTDTQRRLPSSNTVCLHWPSGQPASHSLRAAGRNCHPSEQADSRKRCKGSRQGRPKP